MAIDYIELIADYSKKTILIIYGYKARDQQYEWCYKDKQYRLSV